MPTSPTHYCTVSTRLDVLADDDPLLRALLLLLLPPLHACGAVGPGVDWPVSLALIKHKASLQPMQPCEAHYIRVCSLPYTYLQEERSLNIARVAGGSIARAAGWDAGTPA